MNNKLDFVFNIHNTYISAIHAVMTSLENGSREK